MCLEMEIVPAPYDKKLPLLFCSHENLRLENLVVTLQNLWKS